MSDEQRTVVVQKDRGSEIGAFVLGAVVGAGLALLFAPGSGEDTQQRLREQARKLKDLTEDRVRVIRDDLGARVESAKGAVEQGRQLASGARNELEEKLQRSKAAYRAGIEAARQAASRVAGDGASGASEDPAPPASVAAPAPVPAPVPEAPAEASPAPAPVRETP